MNMKSVWGSLYAAAFLAVILTAISNGEEIGNIDDIVDCSQYISCSEEGEQYGLTREKYLDCLNMLGEKNMESIVQYFRNAFNQPSLDSYNDLINYACEHPQMGTEALRNYYEMKRDNPPMGTPEQQEKTNDYRRCLHKLVDKCKALENNGTISVPDY